MPFFLFSGKGKPCLRKCDQNWHFEQNFRREGGKKEKYIHIPFMKQE